jgi:hypothetical protein
MENETADIAVLVTKDQTDDWYTTEVIVDGEVIKSGTYATKQGALRFASMQTIQLTNANNNEGKNQ